MTSYKRSFKGFDKLNYGKRKKDRGKTYSDFDGIPIPDRNINIFNGNMRRR
jgi:hypothetical protein